MLQLLRTNWQYLVTLILYICFDPEIPLLDTHFRKTSAYAQKEEEKNVAYSISYRAEKLKTT